MTAPAAKAVPRQMTLLALIAATYFMVAGGPFGLEDIVLRSGYAGAILILLITPVIWSLPTALMVSELASAIPEDGGYYVWVKRGMGNFWGYQEAWLSLVASFFDMAIYPTLFVGYLGHLAPSVTANGRGFWIGVVLIAVTSFWNLLGSRIVGGSSVVMAIVMLSPFAILAMYALFQRNAGGGQSVPLSNVDFLGAIAVAMFNYMGFDDASPIAGEVERPQRTYPIAMAVTCILVAASYVLPIAAVSLTGLDANRWTPSSWADIARTVFHNGAAGTVAAVAITIGGMLGAAGTLNAFTMSYSRIPAVLADDGYLPRILSRRNAAGAPWVSIFGCSIIWALCLRLSFVELILLDVLLKGLSVLLEFAALVALRRREPEMHRPYRVPGGMTGAIAVGIPPTILLILTAARTENQPLGPINALELSLILIAAGVVAYFIGAHVRKAKTTS
ncbi:Amino acid permease-associated region [Candidatus Sulfopaludibacter sp. SbA3]|nr:Amino acid permease-associated region [Candidatus Sulfopaludibacter sp. SbA3]